MCNEELNSPHQAHNTDTWIDTWGNRKKRTRQCPWSPHHNQCPDVRGTLHENLFGIKDKERKTLGDSSLERKETGIKDIKRRHKKCHGKRNLDAFGEKCHWETQK